MLHIQLVALALAAITLAASGCGGSSKTESSTTAAVTPTASTKATTAASDIPPVTPKTVTVATGKPLTHAQLIAKAEAICGRQHEKVSAIQIIHESEFAREVPQIAIYDNTELKELSKLVPPASMTQIWGQILAADSLFSEYINRIATYAAANNYKSGGALYNPLEQARRKLFALTKTIGLKNCSQLS